MEVTASSRVEPVVAPFGTEVGASACGVAQKGQTTLPSGTSFEQAEHCMVALLSHSVLPRALLFFGLGAGRASVVIVTSSVNHSRSSILSSIKKAGLAPG